MKKNNYLRVAAYQGEPIEGCPDKALDRMLEITQQAHADQVDILTFPECFLHGYFEDEVEAREHSCELNSKNFIEIVNSFKGYSPAVIFGLNERKGSKLYNSAVVVEDGVLKGIYRKHNTYLPYNYYSVGEDVLIVTVKKTKVGVLICYDSTFLYPARELAKKGARVLIIPSFNRISKEYPMPEYFLKKNHLVARSGENDCWVVLSDITYQTKKAHCPGYTCIYSSDGNQVAQSIPYQEMLLYYDIPIECLKKVRAKRLER